MFWAPFPLKPHEEARFLYGPPLFSGTGRIGAAAFLSFDQVDVLTSMINLTTDISLLLLATICVVASVFAFGRGFASCAQRWRAAMWHLYRIFVAQNVYDTEIVAFRVMTFLYAAMAMFFAFFWENLMTSDQFIANVKWINSLDDLLANMSISLQLFRGVYIADRFFEADANSKFAQLLGREYGVGDMNKLTLDNPKRLQYFDDLVRGKTTFVAETSQVTYLFETICLFERGRHFHLSEETFFDYLQGPLYRLNISRAMRAHLDHKFLLILESGTAKYQFEKHAFSPASLWPIGDPKYMRECFVSSVDQFVDFLGMDMNTGKLSYGNIESFWRLTLCCMAVSLALFLIETLRFAFDRWREKRRALFRTSTKIHCTVNRRPPVHLLTSYQFSGRKVFVNNRTHLG